MYRLIYRHRGKASHSWIYHFRDLKPNLHFSFETPRESAMSWFETFRPFLRWAVVLDACGKVVFDWRRTKHTREEIP